MPKKVFEVEVFLNVLDPGSPKFNIASWLILGLIVIGVITGSILLSTGGHPIPPMTDTPISVPTFLPTATDFPTDVPTATDFPTPTESDTAVPTEVPTKIYCLGLDSLLQKGMSVQVSNTPPEVNNVRKSPSPDSDIVAQIPPGTRMKLLDGPFCDNGVFMYWKVKITSGGNKGLIGYTAETDSSGVRWLVP